MVGHEALGKVGLTLSGSRALLALLLTYSALPALAVPQVAILPLPAVVQDHEGSLRIASGETITSPVGDAAAAAAAHLLAKRVADTRGLRLRETSGGAGAIRLLRDATITAAEGYRLSISSDAATIEARTDVGLLYGAISLLQLLSADADFGKPVTLQARTIDDAPRFAWRGLMLDVARHFQPLQSLYALLDAMAEVKLNTLHLHLTDDQGWRVEIKAYPQLIAVGSLRTPPSSGAPSTAKVGGFYTQAQLKALVKHAALLGITIVPEIDLPGHAQALVAAYPEFGVFGDHPAVASGWGVFPYLLNPNPHGVAFVKTVLDEIMAVFPSSYIHLGGDEAIKDQWQRSPAIQAQIKSLGLRDEEHLQSWLMNQFAEYLAAHGRRLIGWDEILEGGLPPSATVMSWRGEKGAIAAANAAHAAVLSPAPALYFDRLQSDLVDELTGRRANQTLADIYRYEPLPAGLAPDKMQYVLGAQANVWTEYLSTPYQVQHMVFPRAAALAEVTWSRKEARDFEQFLPRLAPQIARWRRMGVHVADSAFAVSYSIAGSRGDALRKGAATIALGTQTAWGTIRYTLDGSLPDEHSPVYSQPLNLPLGTQIRAQAFAAGQTLAAVRDMNTHRAALLTRSASELGACPDTPLRLRVPLTANAKDGAPVFDINQFDMCSTYPQAPLDIASHFSIQVARLPRELGLAHEAYALRDPYAVTAHGELLVSRGCPAIQHYEQERAVGAKPDVIATFVLPDPASAPVHLRFNGSLPKQGGDQDLCLQFTAPLSNSYYAIERMTLSE